MSAWTLIQVVFNIFMCTGIFVILMRMNRAPKDDPRLSRGLQLLQSKISVMEDLSDRTEAQVGQLTAILEQKSREVQAKVQLAEQHVHEIRVSMERSLEVAKIFQDKIPHKEIIERQNTIKYVQAARLAHQGLNAEEIAKQVELPKGEIEFIASVNRDRLVFDESSLPEWARPENEDPSNANTPLSSEVSGDAAFAAPVASFTAAMPSHSFEEAPAGLFETQQEASTRLKAEMELAENQRLVENLSRLQFEMQNLDMQLARENGSRDLSGAFEVPKVETASLKKLGEEFRRAVEEGEINDAKPGFLPLDQLSSLIPHVMSAAEAFAPPTATGSGAAMPAPMKEARVGAETEASAPIANNASPATTAAARASAAERLREALRATAPAAKTTESSELSMARAIAKEQSAPVTKHLINGRSTSVQPTIQKIRFPRLDESET